MAVSVTVSTTLPDGFSTGRSLADLFSGLGPVLAAAAFVQLLAPGLARLVVEVSPKNDIALDKVF